MDEVMRTSEVGALLKHTNSASTRRWIANRKLNACGRDTDTGEKLYLAEDVTRARQEAPGQGTRTDLTDRPSAAKEPRHEHGDRLPPD